MDGIAVSYADDECDEKVEGESVHDLTYYLRF